MSIKGNRVHLFRNYIASKIYFFTFHFNTRSNCILTRLLLRSCMTELSPLALEVVRCYLFYSCLKARSCWWTLQTEPIKGCQIAQSNVLVMHKLKRPAFCRHWSVSGDQSSWSTASKHNPLFLTWYSIDDDGFSHNIVEFPQGCEIKY